MKNATAHEIFAAGKSPFQLFSAFTEADKYRFFGRERETALLYQSVQEANVILLYGESGTGKTSIVQCGLLNETKHFNWSTITIRRIDDINASLLLQLKNSIKDEQVKQKELNVSEMMDEVFMSNFQPILLVFDQFEEIFVYGNEQERLMLSKNISQISVMRIPWKMVFIIREDFLAQLDEFERELPGLFKKRLRIELMDKSNCREVIVKTCELFKIELTPLHKNAKGETVMFYNKTAPDTPDIIINTVSDTKNAIHLPYFQVFLDKLSKEAWKYSTTQIKIDKALVQKVGNMGDVLKGFLEEKVTAQTILSSIDAWKFLKLFVPEKEKGTTRKKVNLKEYSAIPEATLNAIVEYFGEYKILTGCAEDSYELAHESLVPIIQNKKGNEIRVRLLAPNIKGNPYKGLTSFNQSDSYRFYGRREAIKNVYEKVSQYDFVAIVGNSGTGKSSLIKAGLFPLLIIDGYKILPIVKAGDSPIDALDNSYREAETDKGHKKFILLIDQYEELNTRISRNQTREDVYNWIEKLLEKQKSGQPQMAIKIIITIRADFEPQFSVKPQLAQYWKLGKFIIPPFTREEIREVIDEPAYQAGLEFSPPSLVEKITEEVYSSQSTGLIPLMSFTLKELYNKYVERGNNDNLLLEEDYLALGGVIGGLQNRAQHIYDSFQIEHPNNYVEYQIVMQHIILRMIYISTGEIAGQRVLKENLVYKDDEINIIKDGIIKSLINSDLILAKVNNKEEEYYEPAHDVFIRSWGQIWDWINVEGKDKLSLRSRLAQAVDEHYGNGQNQELLWDNKLTEELLQEMQSKNTWLNKKEHDFIASSMQKRDDAAALLRQIEEDKLEAQKEKEQHKEEKIKNQRSKLKATRTFAAVISLLLVVAIAISFWAYKQRREAVMYSKNADDNLNTANTLSKALRDTNKTLSLSRIELQDKADSLEQQAVNLAIQTMNAKKAELNARKAEKNANYAALNEKVQRIKAEDAEAKAKILSIELANKVNSANSAKKIIENLYKELVETNRSRDSTKTAFNIQKQQNTAQLVNLSKRLEIADIVKAYRVAELAYQKDSTDTATIRQYNKLQNQPAYYYTRNFQGNLSRYSPDNNHILTTTFGYTTDFAYPSIVLSQINPSKFLGQLFGKNLISADFSPSSKNIILTYKDNIEIYPINNLQEKINLEIKEKDIVAAKYSPDEEQLLVIGESRFAVYQDDVNIGGLKKVFSGDFGSKEKVNNAVFSNDGQRIIASSETGKVAIWDVQAGRKILDLSQSISVSGTYLSSSGNCFMISTQDALFLYDSKGKLTYKNDNLVKYNSLNEVTFSQDGKQVLLSFSSNMFNKSQINFSKKELGKISLLLMHVDKNISPQDITKKIDPYDLEQFLSITPIFTIDGDKLLYGLSNGLVKCVNLSTDAIQLLTGHSKPVGSIYVLNSSKFIMTSSADNTTKIWQYDAPKNLNSAGLLPKLTMEDLKNFGLDK